MPLTVNLRPIDLQRVRRLVIAWQQDDQYAVHAVLQEAEPDTEGAAGLILA